MAELIVREVPLAATRALRQAVLRPQQSLASLAEQEADGATALGAFEDGALVAVGLVAPEQQRASWRIRGMATAPDARRRGAGTAILAGLIEHAAAGGAERVWCNARTPARSLYERAGFTVVSEQFELPEIGPHVVMERRIRRR